jgi:hypothetical protein
VDALLLSLVEPVLQVKDKYRGSRNLKVVEIYEVTETKHLSFVVLLLAFSSDLFVLFNLLLFLIVVAFVLIESLVKVDTFLIELTLPVDETEKLAASE